jgi:hypothetical protein
MASGINDLLERISTLEEKVKAKYPRAEGKVKIANAKSNVQYSFKDPETANSMEWAARYYEELNNIL